MRRCIDLAVAIFCLTVFAPVLLLIALLIQADSSGPVLYIPQMVGQYGKVFFLFRFRTMSKGRLTRAGKFICNYSLDHLPMLINLLKGDLTLVGPRPMETTVVDFSDPIWKKYLQVKPGLFNYAVFKLGKFWTSARRSDPTLNQELELEYLQKRTARSDLQIVLQSMRMLFISRGNIKARGEPAADVKDRIEKVS